MTDQPDNSNERYRIDLNEFLRAPITQVELDRVFMQIDASLELERLPPPTSLEVDFLLSMRMFVCRVAHSLYTRAPGGNASELAKEVKGFLGGQCSPESWPEEAYRLLKRCLAALPSTESRDYAPCENPSCDNEMELSGPIWHRAVTDGEGEQLHNARYCSEQCMEAVLEATDEGVEAADIIAELGQRMEEAGWTLQTR